MQILIRQMGTLIDVSPDGRSPLPPSIVDELVPHLTYQHTKMLRGAEAYDAASGERNRVIITPRRMYRMEQGRVTTGYGFISKITEVLTSKGHDVRYIDLSPPKSNPDCYTLDWDNLWSKFTPRVKQPECLQAIASHKGGLIDATMGYGKTHLFPAICHLYPKAKIAIVVKPVDVAARIVRQLTGQFPNVGQVGGGKRRMGDRITVFTAGSVHLADGYEFDIVLCDEAHQLMSDSYSSKLAAAFTNTRNYAFTATPDSRLDNAHAKLEMFFGPKIFYMPYPEAVEHGLVVPIHVRWLNFHSQYNPARGKVDVSKMRHGIWRHEERNAMIAEDIKATYPGNNDQILVATATVDHAIHLWRHMPDFELCYSNSENIDLEGYMNSGLIPHGFVGMTSSRRDSLRNGFEKGDIKRVIATDVWSTGVDFEQLQTIVRADARSSETLTFQWGGRPSRLFDGKMCGEVVDIIDNFDPGFKRKSETRKRHYKKLGWSQDWPSGKRQIGNV